MRHPGMSGRKMSSVTIVGMYSLISEIAAAAVALTRPLKPCRRAASSSTFANARSFSTIRIVRSPGWMLARSSSASLRLEAGVSPST
jgi:hypothetical protein